MANKAGRSTGRLRLLESSTMSPHLSTCECIKNSTFRSPFPLHGKGFGHKENKRRREPDLGESAIRATYAEIFFRTVAS